MAMGAPYAETRYGNVPTTALMPEANGRHTIFISETTAAESRLRRAAILLRYFAQLN